MDQALEDLIPGIVKPYTGWIVGMDWPEAREDTIFKKVEALTNAGKGTDGVGTSGDITFAAVKACMDGVAADSFGKYWDQFTKADPQFLPNLTKACNEAAKQLESYGLDVEYTKYMILFSLILLAFQIAYFIAMAAPSFGASLSLIPGACAITQMGVRQLAITLLRNILFSTAVMEGMDAGIQGIQMLEGHRKSWDWDKTKASIEGGVMTGLAFTGMAGLLSKMGGSRLASAAAQDLKFGDLTGREKFASFMTNSWGGHMLQSGAANMVGSVPMLAASGQLDLEHLAKAGTSGLIGAADGHLIKPTATGPHGGPPPPGDLVLPEAHPTATDAAHHPALDGPPPMDPNRILSGDYKGPSGDGGGVVPAGDHIPPGEHDTGVNQPVSYDGSGQPVIPHQESGQPHQTVAYDPGGASVDPSHPAPHTALADAHQPTAGDGHGSPGIPPSQGLRPDAGQGGRPDAVRPRVDQEPAVVPVTPVDGHPAPSDTGRAAVPPSSRADQATPGRTDQPRGAQPTAAPDRAAQPTGRAGEPAPVRGSESPAREGMPATEAGRGSAQSGGRQPEVISTPVDLGRDRSGSSASHFDLAAADHPVGHHPGGPGGTHHGAGSPLTAESLSESMRSGVHDSRHLGGGNSAEAVNLVTYNDGRRVVEKVVHTPEELHGELLTALVGQAIGAPVPRAIIVGDRTIVMDYVEGTPGREMHRDFENREDLPYWQSPEGRRLGLLDLLVGNSDRGGFNWLVGADGRVSGVDHSAAFTRPGADPLGRPGGFTRLGVNPRENPFVTDYARPQGLGGYEIVDHPLSRMDVQLVRRSIEALRPEFERLGRHTWYGDVMHRLDGLHDHATGTRPLYDDASPFPSHQDPVVHDEGGPSSHIDDLLNRPDAGRPPEGAPRPSGERALADGVASGIRDLEPMVDRSAPEELGRITFNDGSVAVRREFRFPQHADAEALTAIVGQAIGAPVPAAHQDGLTVYTEHIDGRTAREAIGLADLPTWTDSPEGLRLGLLDTLVSNPDRTGGNWLVGADGGLHGVDHSDSFKPGLGPSPELNGFAAHYLAEPRATRVEWKAENPLTSRDVEVLRQRLESVRPEFERRGRLDWHDDMMGRLEEAARHAAGTDDRPVLDHEALSHGTGARVMDTPRPGDPAVSHTGVPHEVHQIRSADLNPDTRPPLMPSHGEHVLGLLRGEHANALPESATLHASQWAHLRQSAEATPVGREHHVFENASTVEVRRLSVNTPDGLVNRVTEYTVKLRFQADPSMTPHDVARAQSNILDAADLSYNHQHRLPDRSQTHVRVEFEEVPPPARGDVVQLLPGNGTLPGERPSMLRLYADMDPAVIAHELGHHLGLEHEYVDPRQAGNETLTAPGVHRDPSVMGSGRRFWADHTLIVDHNGNAVPALAGLRDRHLIELQRLADHATGETRGEAAPAVSAERAAWPSQPDISRHLPDHVRDLLDRTGEDGRPVFPPEGRDPLEHALLLDRMHTLFEDRVPPGELTTDHLRYTEALTDAARRLYDTAPDYSFRASDLLGLRHLADAVGAAPGGMSPSADLLHGLARATLGRDPTPRDVQGLTGLAEHLNDIGGRREFEAAPDALDRAAGDRLGTLPGTEPTVRAVHEIAEEARQAALDQHGAHEHESGPAADTASTPEHPTARRHPSEYRRSDTAPSSPLEHGIDSGVADRRPMHNGSSGARVEHVTFNDGSSAVHLEFSTKLDADREYLALRTGEAAYAPVPGAVRDGETGIFTGYVEGKSAAERGLVYDPNLIHSDRGRLLGFFDTLIANRDRSGFNWLVTEQRGRFGATNHQLSGGIDHRLAFADAVISPVHSPFAEPFVRRGPDGQYTWTYSPIHRSDIALIRPRLEALRPEFAALGHPDWHASMMERFEKLALFAAGERPLITHSEAMPAGREFPRSAPSDDAGHQAPAEHPGHPDPVRVDLLHSLPGHQREAVERLLTDDGVRRMNDGLRSDDPHTRAEAQIWARNTAEGLEALPVADRTTVYHYTSLSPEHLAEFVPGAHVTMHGVMDGRSIHTPGHGHPVELIVHSRTGADVSIITGRDQVVFGPEARFQVLAKEHLESAGIDRIFLAELPRDGSPLPGTAEHPEIAAMTPRPMDERLQNVFDAAREETAAGVAYFHPDDPRSAAMLDSARRAKPIEGVFSFDLHAAPSHARVGSERLNGRDSATLLSHEPALTDPRTSGHPLVLRSMGCRTGRGEHPLAQDIANETGRIVIAPDDEVWVDANGDVQVSAPRIGPDGRPRPMRFPPEGSWRIFVPEGRPTTPAHALPEQLHGGTRDAGSAHDTSLQENRPDSPPTHPHELRRSAPEDGTPPGPGEQPTPASPGMGQSHASRRAEIARSVASGIDHDRTELLGRNDTGESHALSSERVELVTFNDGAQAIRKEVMADHEDGADAEELSALVGHAVDAPVPHVYRESERVLYLDHLEGTVALVRYPEAYEPALLDHLGYQETRGARLLGLLDVLVENSDRHNGNWMIGPHDEVLGYDHNMAFHGWAPNPRANSFVENYISEVRQNARGQYEIEWARNDLSRHDIEVIEQRLQALRPDFERLGRTDWYEQVMDRFSHIKENASGTVSVLEPEGHGSAGPRESGGFTETEVPRRDTPGDTRATAFSEWGDRAEAIRRALPPDDVPYGGHIMDMAANQDGHAQVFDRAEGINTDPATYEWLKSALEFAHEPTGIRAEIAEISYGGRAFEVMLRFAGPDGREAGFADIYTFTGLPGHEGTVAHYGNIGLHITDQQGHGFGAELQDRLENWFIGQDISVITLTAGGETGTYAWARSGFTFSDRRSFEGVVDHFRQGAGNMSEAGRRDWAALESRLTPEAFDGGYGATAYELSRLGWEDRQIGPDGRLTWDGKRLLLEGPAWRGDKYLLPPEDGGGSAGRPEGPDDGGPGNHGSGEHRGQRQPSDGTDTAASHPEAPAPRQDAPDGRASFDEWGDRAEAIRQALPPDGLPHHGNIRDIILTTDGVAPVHPAVRQWIDSVLGFDHPQSGLRLSIDEAAVIDDGNMLLHGEFTDAAGDRQGELVVNVHTDGHLEIGLVELYDGYQGRGVGVELMERLDNWAIGQGIHDMRLWANIDSGGYAWTRYGFDFDIRYPYDVSGLPNIVDTVESVIRSGEMSPEGVRDWEAMAHRATREAWYTPDRVTAYEIGRLGWDARRLGDDGHMTWDGKEILRSSGWQGARHLEPPNAPHEPTGPRDAGGPVTPREPDGRSDPDHPAAPVPDQSPSAAEHRAPFAEWGDQARAIEAALPTPDELPAGETLKGVLENGALESPRDGFGSWLDRVVGFEHPSSGVHARVETWSIEPDVLKLKLKLYHGGDEIGFGERVIRLSADDELIASHDFIYLADSTVQTQGFGTAWNEHLENWYISQGVKEIRLLANVDVGGYAWARSFDFSEQPGMSRFGTPTLGEPPITWETSEFRGLVGWVEQHIADGRMSEQGRMDWAGLRERATQDAWENGYRLTPAEFGRIGWDARTVDSDGRMMWDGKRILLEFGKDVHEGGGGGWHGVRRLVPPADPSHGVPGESGSHPASAHDQDAPAAGVDPGALRAALESRLHELGVTGLGPEFRSTAEDHQALRDAMGEERYQDRRHYADMSVEMDRNGGGWADPLYGLPAEARAEVYDRIPEADRVALYDYTGSAFNKINEALRTGDLAALAHYAPQIRCIVSALNHLPIHEGPVERNIYAPSDELPDVLARYEHGAAVTEDTFLSTSPDPDSLQSGNVRFTIESRTGRETLPGLTGDPGEREVLFPPGSRFEVTGVEPTADGAHIHLRELPPERTPGIR